MRLSVTAAFAFLVAQPALADPVFQGGNEIFKTCTAGASNVPSRGYCLGYVAAVADSLTNNEINGYRACVPEDVTTGQLVDVAVLFLRQNPAKRHLGAAGLIAHALDDAFPCP